MVWILSVVGAIIVVAFYFNCSSVAGGVIDSRLVSCPNRPNCVCSYDHDSEHQIGPIDVSGIEDPMQTLVELIKTFPRASIVSQKSNYIHVVFRSKVFRFTDDVEFYYAPKEGVVHVRSASRLGYRDFGVNRARIEEIRKQIQS